MKVCKVHNTIFLYNKANIMKFRTGFTSLIEFVSHMFAGVVKRFRTEKYLKLFGCWELRLKFYNQPNVYKILESAAKYNWVRPKVAQKVKNKII